MKSIVQTFCFVLFLFYSLYGSAQTKQKDTSTFFEEDSFIGDTLYIKAVFMECGEWGGHLELSKVFLKKNEFYLTYLKYRADCDRIKENNGEPPQTLIRNTTKKLSDKDKTSIKQWFHQLIDAKFREPSPAGFQYTFELRKSDDTINIRVNTWGSRTATEYSAFIKRLLE